MEGINGSVVGYCINVLLPGSSDMSMSSAISSIASALPIPWDIPRYRRDAVRHEWVMDLMVREGDGISRMLWRLLGNEADVLDAFQDTFCHLAQRGSSADLRSARAYAYRTATNIGIELIRTRKRHERHRERIAEHYDCSKATGVAEADGPGKVAAENEQLREALGLLPKHLRSVVVLRDLAGLSYEEISTMLHIGAATARVYRRHAVVRLAELLEGGRPSC